MEGEQHAARGTGYEWQLSVGQDWFRIDNDHVIETHYCQPNAKGMTINTTSTRQVYIDFDCVATQGSASGIRRLSFLSQGLAEDVGWYYRDNRLWREYGSQASSNSTSSVCSKVVEQNHNHNPQGTFRFTVGGSAYSLDFSAMTQTNLATLVQRKVRRRPKFNSVVSANQSTSSTSPTSTSSLAPSAGCTWEFMGEEGIWTEYKADQCSLDSAVIESHYQQNPQGKLCFKAGRFSYTLDFAVMDQTNDTIGTRRSVRRSQGAQQSSRSQPRWQFNNENGTWSDYTQRGGRGGCSVSSQDIEVQYQLNPHGTMAFTTRSFNYQLDFSAMTQTNLSTLTSRAVRRLHQ